MRDFIREAKRTWRIVQTGAPAGRHHSQASEVDPVLAYGSGEQRPVAVSQGGGPTALRWFYRLFEGL